METIRTFSEGDYDKLIRLWKRAKLGLTLSDIQDEIDRFVKYNPKSFFILELDKQVIGSVIATFDGRRGYVYHVAVDPDHQGLGYGKRLMDHIDRYYKSINAVKVHLMIDTPNEIVVNFYKKVGWVLRDDIIVMSKSFRTSSS